MSIGGAGARGTYGTLSPPTALTRSGWIHAVFHAVSAPQSWPNTAARSIATRVDHGDDVAVSLSDAVVLDGRGASLTRRGRARSGAIARYPAAPSASSWWRQEWASSGKP